jgi:selenocysteine lyase/cysteine desulfurase
MLHFFSITNNDYFLIQSLTTINYLKGDILKSIDFDYIRNEIIGRDFIFHTPYGKRLLTYADYTASGRTLEFIEKYLIHVQRSYANTHTEDDVTGRNMTGLLHKAEKMILKSFNAEKNCKIIATGTGTTGAISKFQEIIGVRFPAATKLRINEIKSDFIGEDVQRKEIITQFNKDLEKQKPVVFISNFEHHSNDILWRESFTEVVMIDFDSKGHLDLKDLEQKVADQKYNHRFKIGSFSATSNITGLKSPVYEIARILHENNAIACFDFAACAPYVKIDMNRDDKSYFDAIYFSPHKFIGGPGSSGILVFNENLYNRGLPPTNAAGGTVDYVSRYSVDYIEDIETREKPGTPGILQTLKAALVINLKDVIGIENIEDKEYYFTEKAFSRLSQYPNIVILGSQNPEDRIPIFSFLIKDGDKGDKYLHPKLGTRLLNDLFGVQSRAGCSCAGVYGHYLLDIDYETSEKYRKLIQKGILSIKPGWIRVNFHYTISEIEFDFICSAIEFLADQGPRFISEYNMNLSTGEWNHKNFEDKDIEFNPTISNILELSLKDCFEEKHIEKETEFAKYLEEANEILKTLPEIDKFSKFADNIAEEMRWFNFLNSS